MKNVIRSICLPVLLAATAFADNAVITNPPTQPVPVKTVPFGTTISSVVKASSLLLKPTAGVLRTITVTSDSDQYILVIDSATVPVNGAVTLLCPPIHVGAASTTMINFAMPLRAVNGIAVCNSNANSFTKTSGAADCIFTGQVE